MGDAMRDGEQLVVLYEISSLAQEISKKYNIEWGLIQESPFDSVYYLRSANSKDIVISSKSLETIRTGIYVQLTDPRIRMEVVTNSNVLRSKNIGVLNNIFDYDFRNELTLIIYNYGNTEQIISQGEIIANLSFIKFPLVTFKNVTMINPGEKYKGTKDNNWVQEEKKERKQDITAKNYLANSEKNIKINRPMVHKIIKERTE